MTDLAATLALFGTDAVTSHADHHTKVSVDLGRNLMAVAYFDPQSEALVMATVDTPIGDRVSNSFDQLENDVNLVRRAHGMSHAEAMARVTGSVSATVTKTRRDADGNLTSTSSETFTF